jgi:hypothetical protein
MFRLTGLAVVVTLSTAPPVLSTHGSAQWIAEGNFVGLDGLKCCGPTDCEHAPASGVARVRGGWSVPGTQQFFPDDSKPGLYFSTDGDLWWCRRDQGGIQKVQCLFVPPGSA